MRSFSLNSYRTHCKSQVLLLMPRKKENLKATLTGTVILDLFRVLKLRLETGMLLSLN